MSQKDAIRFVDYIKAHKPAARKLEAMTSGKEARKFARDLGYSFTRKEAQAAGAKLGIATKDTRVSPRTSGFWLWVGRAWAKVCSNGGGESDSGGSAVAGVRG